MMKITRSTLILVCALLTGLTSQAQSSDTPVAIGIFAGPTDYSGEINGHTLWDFDNDMNIHLGAEVGFYINEAFDFAANVHGGGFGDQSTQNENLRFKGRFTALNFNVRYKLANGKLLSLDSKIQPYFLVGGGFADYKNDTDEPGLISKGLQGHAKAGLGLKVPLSDKLSLDFRNTYAYTNSDAIDLIDQDGNEFFMTLTGGLSYGLGNVVDTDGDGVSDKKDACPTVAGVPALAGCPDSDGDGVADKDDACPNKAGTAAMSGCPDSDGDGVNDSEDKCPNVSGPAAMAGCPDSDGDGVPDSDDACPKIAGPVEMAGCPDTDGDGIADNMDKCPQVAGVTSARGCPDSDGDGVADSDDKCPNKKGSATLNGCPDSDGDGVGDATDKCPNQKGSAANNGCPGVSAEAQQVFDQALRGVQFESSKDVIKTQSYAILNNVVKVMNDNPSYKLFIQGHTDSQGNDDFNQSLSEKRAAAVKRYLVNKGIDTSRMRTAGFGETQPVADNGTAAGRAQNRRVAFKVEF